MVIPNVGGIALLSPRLDELGNSARGIEFSHMLAKKFGLHFLQFKEREVPTEEEDDVMPKGLNGFTKHANTCVNSSSTNSTIISHLNPPTSHQHLPPQSHSHSNSSHVHPHHRGERSGKLGSPSPCGSSYISSLIRTSATSKYHDSNIAFIFACSQGDLGLVRSLMASAVDMNACDYDGRTPLHLAASNGHTLIVEILLRKGVEVNPVDRFHGTPLTDAIREGHLEMSEQHQRARRMEEVMIEC